MTIKKKCRTCEQFSSTIDKLKIADEKGFFVVQATYPVCTPKNSTNPPSYQLSPIAQRGPGMPCGPDANMFNTPSNFAD